jgi:hypothetical protein
LTSSGYRINRFGSEAERELWINKPSFTSSQYNINIEGVWSGSTATTVGIAIQFYNGTTYVNGFNGMLYPLNSASFSFSDKSVDTANRFCVVIWYSTSPASETCYLTITKLWLSSV